MEYPTPTCGGSKFSRNISGASRPRLTPGPPAQGSSARKISQYNFWLQKPVEIVSGRNFWNPKQFLLKNPHTDTPNQTHSL